MLLPECTTARAKESPMPWSKPAHSPFGRAHCTVVCRWLSECDSASVDYMLAEWQRIGGLCWQRAAAHRWTRVYVGREPCRTPPWRQAEGRSASPCASSKRRMRRSCCPVTFGEYKLTTGHSQGGKHSNYVFRRRVRKLEYIIETRFQSPPRAHDPCAFFPHPHPRSGPVGFLSRARAHLLHVRARPLSPARLLTTSGSWHSRWPACGPSS